MANLTLDRYHLLTAYWRRHPPIHLAFALVHGMLPAVGQPSAGAGRSTASSTAQSAPGEWRPFGEAPSPLTDLGNNLPKGKMQDPKNYEYW